MVPAPAAAPAAAPAHAGNPLVPRPPGGGPRLALGERKTADTAPPKSVPIRNLAPPPPPKENKLIKILVTVVVLAGLGVGGYYGFLWLKDYQAKRNADTAREEGSGESQVGHIANLNKVLDATDPARGSSGRPRLGSAAGAEADAAMDAASALAAGGTGPSPAGAPGAAAGAEKQLPVVPAVWDLNVGTAKVPQGRVNGSISGSPFVSDIARIDLAGTAYVLQFVQGAITSPDRGVLVYLHLKPGEKLGGQTITISQDMKGSTVPQVAKRWKPDPKFAPSIKRYYNGYAMKLELGPMADNVVPGKIFLALPDDEKSVVAGVFRATNNVPDVTAQATPYAAPNPTATPTSPNANDAYQRRYGIRR